MESSMGSTHVAREQGSCSHGCACSGPESGVQNIRGTITTLKVYVGNELMSRMVRSLVHVNRVKLSSKVKELAPKVPMRLNECNARNDYDLGMSSENVRRTLVRFTYIIPKFVF